MSKMIERLMNAILVLAGTGFLVAAALTLWPARSAHAHGRSDHECTEAAEMIGHFADARDAHSLDESKGVGKEEALSQYDAGWEVVKTFPPELRWFLEDDDDNNLLRAGVEKVFDHPELTPEMLNTEFKAGCIQRAKHSTYKPVGPACCIHKVASNQAVIPQAINESRTTHCYQRGIAAKHMAMVIMAGLSKNEFWHRHQLEDTVAPEVRQELHDYIDRAYENVEKHKSPRAFQKAEFERCMDEPVR